MSLYRRLAPITLNFVLLKDIQYGKLSKLRIIIYPLILEKLRVKQGVSVDEVEQTFLNRSGMLAKEVREQHLGDETHWWFISTTDMGRELKVVFIKDDRRQDVRDSAYEPNDDEVKRYEKIQRQKRK